MTNSSGVSGPRDRVLELLGTGRAACNGYDRADLVPRLDAAHWRVLDPGARIVVCGDFKQGKSALVNALLDSQFCPVDDDVATAVATSVSVDPGNERYEVVFSAPHTRDEAAEPARYSVTQPEARTAITTSTLNGHNVESVDAWLPSGPAAMTFIDAPGSGGLGSPHAKATLAALSDAAAVIFVSDASQEYTRAELDFLAECRDRCPHVILVMTKVDLHPHWRTILDTNAAHLHAAGIDAQIVAVSAELHAEAQRGNINELRLESGIPALLDRLHREVAEPAVTAAHADAVGEVRLVIEQLEAPFLAERRLLTDPAARDRALAELQEAEARANSLRTAASRWQIMLNDGVSDLMSDVDHDFRGRMRRLAAEASALIDEGAPAEIWPEMGPWLEQRVAEDVLANFDFLNDRADTLNRAVASLFADDAGEFTARLGDADADAAMSKVAGLEAPEFTSDSKLVTGIAAARGGSSGVFMFNTVAGLALGATALTALPVVAMTAVVALVSGRGALRQGNERQLAQQRTAARTALRSYTDDVTFRIAKELQAIMRNTQRTIRDHYALRAEEVHRTSVRALEAARAAANQGEGSARVRDIDAELARLNRVASSAAELHGQIR